MMKRILSMLLCLLALSLLMPAAFAEEKTAAERGLEAIMATGHGRQIVLPQEESYLEEWKTLYCRKAWYAPSLYVESLPQLQSGVPTQHMLYEGTEVTVVAEENDMSCILYPSRDYDLNVGWIQSIRLLEDFPGPEYQIGQAPDGEYEKRGKVALRWSGEYFPGTEQPFTVLGETLRGCVGFGFEYQVTAENTSLKDIILGPRTVYVRSGKEWTALGSFPYPEFGAVRVQVWLPEPMDVSAIATVADCHAPNMFDFRQTARDFLLLPADPEPTAE